jgi:pilus assembly protein CpaE
MQLTPESSVLDAVGSSGADSMVLKTFLTPHPSGLYALCAPEHPAGADRISGEDVAALLKKLTRQFRYVVVDTSAGLTEHTLGALEHTTDLLLLCGMDVPSVRAMRKELDILDELGLTGPTRSVLLNYVDSHSGLTVKDVEGMLGCAVDIELPRSREVPISTNRGVPLLVAGSRDAAAKELAKLVSRYAPPTTERPQRRVRHLLGAR